jgi:hypothetical protein
MSAALTVIAEQLGRAVNAVQDATGLFEEIEVLADYSGRAMYGATCLGVTSGSAVAAMLLDARLPRRLPPVTRDRTIEHPARWLPRYTIDHPSTRGPAPTERNAP